MTMLEEKLAALHQDSRTLDDFVDGVRRLLREDQPPLPGSPLGPEYLASIRALVAPYMSLTWAVSPDATMVHEIVDRGLVTTKTVAAGMKPEDARFVAAMPRTVESLLAYVNYLTGPMRDALAMGEMDQYLAGRAAAFYELEREIKGSAHIPDVYKLRMNAIIARMLKR